MTTELQMLDILVIKGQHRTVVIGKSTKGEKFILEEMVQNNRNTEPALSINSEFADDLIEDLKKKGLDVEVK